MSFFQHVDPSQSFCNIYIHKRRDILCYYLTISHHIVRNNGRKTAHRGPPSPVTHSTVQARHLVLNLHSRVPVQAAGGKGKACVSVETCQKNK